jgi:hypothetical protein
MSLVTWRFVGANGERENLEPFYGRRAGYFGDTPGNQRNWMKRILSWFFPPLRERGIPSIDFLDVQW